MSKRTTKQSSPAAKAQPQQPKQQPAAAPAPLPLIAMPEAATDDALDLLAARADLLGEMVRFASERPIEDLKWLENALNNLICDESIQDHLIAWARNYNKGQENGAGYSREWKITNAVRRLLDVAEGGVPAERLLYSLLGEYAQNGTLTEEAVLTRVAAFRAEMASARATTVNMLKHYPELKGEVRA